MPIAQLIRSAFAALLLSPALHASTLVVDSAGPSTGTHATIQSAIDAASPGDTVEIRGGVYFEHVILTKGGQPDKPLTVQAAPNELVLINAGRRLDFSWKPAPGLDDVMVAEVPAETITSQTGIWETPSRLRLARVQNPEQVSRRLGSWFHDAEAGRLYLRSTGARTVDQGIYWLESSDKAAFTVKASHVHLRNLQATLGQHGFLLEGKKLSHITVEGCRAFCNSWAGIQVTGDDHRIHRNETFQNNTYGIQLRFGVNRVHVTDNTCLFNGPNNGEATGSSVPTDLGLYSQGEYNLFEGNVVEGLHEDVYRNKTGHGFSQSNILRNNVIKGNQTPGSYGVYNNTLLVDGLGMRSGMYRNGGPASPMRSWDRVDPKGLQRAWNLIHPLVQKEDPRFADPAHRDYRLQGNSPYHGLGAFPGRLPVFFVDPVNGADTNSGLGTADALATPQAALARMSAGGTLYLLPGVYEAPMAIEKLGGLTKENPLRIRAHGKSKQVKITGGMRVAGGQFVEITGLEFTAPLALEKAWGVTVTECIFSSSAAGIRASGSPELRVDHCTFTKTETAVRLEKSPEASITQTLFSDSGTALAVDTSSAGRLFSDFNAFTRFAGELGDKKISGLPAWREASGKDRLSVEQPIRLDSAFLLTADDPLAASAPDFGHLGARVGSAGARLEIKNLQVAGLASRGATLLWDSTNGATFTEITLQTGAGETVASWEPSMLLQIMASSFDVNRLPDAFYSSQRHAALPELQPSTDYAATLVPRDALGHRGAPISLTFRTPAGDGPATTYFLSPEGNDAAGGTTREVPWRTFAHATARWKPGDTLVLLPGRYREILRPRTGGTAGSPVTIRAEKPGEAVLDLAESLQVAVEILNVNHVTVDGLRIVGGDFGRSHCYVINNAQGVTIRNGSVDYPSVASFEKLKLGYTGLTAQDAPGLVVENNLFLCCGWGVAASNSPGTVVRGNTFVGEGNYGVVIIPGAADESYTVEDNLFYRAIMGYKNGPCILVFEPMPRIVSDHNLFYIPENHKGTIGELPTSGRLFPLKAWQEATGLDGQSISAEPIFENPEAGNFSLKTSSPGANLARDGGPVGIRKK
jgi:hypothetical protein